MNRKEFINQYHLGCQKLGLNRADVIVISGGALLMHGLRQTTRDIDCVLPVCLIPTVLLLNVGKIVVAKTIDIPNQNNVQTYSTSYLDFAGVEDPNELIGIVEETDGVYYASLESVLAHKLFMNRPKDQCDIQAIRDKLGV